jgi:type IV pilus assembly protein PilB
MEPSVVSRLKILARMDIAVRRRPQDGRMTARVGDREFHLRVSSMPTVHGENMVLRLLGSNAPVSTFGELGMRDNDKARIERVIRRPNGLILNTGPTGSGKTTTLYTVLSQLNRPEVNIITVEDPVEYRMERIRQVELNTRAGMTFASSLRSILRQDPDIIMVGEIRDRETASIAVQASLTGHLVLSTMHTNDALGTISRLADMGIEPFLISSVLTLVIAQRLVRRICPHCARSWSPPEEALAFWQLSAEEASGADFREAVGCRHCRQTGYRGRLGIFEILEVRDQVKEAILHQAGEQAMLKAAREESGFTVLRQDAAAKLRGGLTSMEEASSVVQHA